MDGSVLAVEVGYAAPPTNPRLDLLLSANFDDSADDRCYANTDSVTIEVSRWSATLEMPLIDGTLTGVTPSQPLRRCGICSPRLR